MFRRCLSVNTVRMTRAGLLVSTFLIVGCASKVSLPAHHCQMVIPTDDGGLKLWSFRSDRIFKTPHATSATSFVGLKSHAVYGYYDPANGGLATLEHFSSVDSRSVVRVYDRDMKLLV